MDPDPQPPGGLLETAGDLLQSTGIAQIHTGSVTPEIFIIPWVVLCVLILLSAFFSGSETSIFSLTKINLARLEREKKKSSAILKRLLDDPRTTLTTILFCNMLVNVAVALTGGTIAELYFPEAPLLSFIAGALGVTLVILIIGEMIPKTLAIERTERFALFSAPVILFLYRVFKPLEHTIQFFTNSIFRMFNMSNVQESSILSEAELKALLTMGEVEGILEEDEKEMIEGVFEFGEKTVEDIMTPRMEMKCVSDSLTRAELLDIVRETDFKRIPVYRETIDHIVGILHLKDLLLNSEQDYHSLLRKPLFVPPLKSLTELMYEFKKARSHIAIVVDEQGGAAGLVTFHDLLEEIVGEVWEQDEDEEEKILQVGASEWLIAGNLEIEEINETITINLPEERGRTLAGFIMNTIGKVPVVGEELETEGVRIRVERMGRNTVERARITGVRAIEDKEEKTE